MEKVCKIHGPTQFFPRTEGWYRCGKCASDAVVKNRRQKKKKLVEMFGGKCVVCGYSKYDGALDFHHRDPKEKDFALSVKGLCYSWESIVAEAKKCVLVCKNCHSEIEAGLTTV
ncbi:HNH endonuclease [Patescibacteria group bacterium]|nr:HNH endonuclease [Patescibacteria group bacterium]